MPDPSSASPSTFQRGITAPCQGRSSRRTWARRKPAEHQRLKTRASAAAKSPGKPRRGAHTPPPVTTGRWRVAFVQPVTGSTPTARTAKSDVGRSRAPPRRAGLIGAPASRPGARNVFKPYCRHQPGQAGHLPTGRAHARSPPALAAGKYPSFDGRTASAAHH